MNYYSPYFSYAPYTAAPASKGILSSILGGVKGVNWSGLLSNVQKTLGIVNQAIPMVKQVSPIVSNAKTMFKIMNEFKKVDTPIKSNNTTNISNTQSSNTQSIDNETIDNTVVENSQSDNGPTFFI